jgi:hypothetical protein
MKRPQVTLCSLLLATSFVGAGAGCLLSSLFNPDVGGLVSLIQLLAAGPLIVAGIFATFQRARIGSYVGFFVGVNSIFAFFIIGYLTHHFDDWEGPWADEGFRNPAAVAFSATAFVIVLAAIAIGRRARSTNE